MRINELLNRDSKFRLAIEQCRPRLYRMALAWCGQSDVADDLCQEALSRALTNRHQLRAIEKFNPWMFAILSNCWREHLRRRRPQVPFTESEHADDKRSLEDDCQTSDLIDCLKRHVARLPNAQRQVLTLVDLEEFSYAETAVILGIPIGTVMSRLHRARSQLRTQMTSKLASKQGRPVLRRVK